MVLRAVGGIFAHGTPLKMVGGPVIISVLSRRSGLRYGFTV